MAPVTPSKPSPGIRVEREDLLLRVTLDRPEQHNALEAADVEALRETLERAGSEGEVRVLVLTGAGDETFCSGASLRQMESGKMSGALFDTLTDRLVDLPLPTVARINGNVYGGGAELALCCDFRIGVRGSRMRVPAARLGVCYPPGGLRRYVTRLGLGPASRILLAAEELDADEMLRVGFLTRLVDPPDLDAQVELLTDELAALAPLAVRNMKRILLDLADGSLDADAARALVEECAGSADQAEGLKAWRERREPRFQGR